MYNETYCNEHTQVARCCGQGQRESSQKGLFCWCSSKVLCFMAVLLGATLGLIFGVVYAADLLIALPTLIVLAIILAIIIIGIVIFRVCLCCKSRACK
ncbi:MAG TPA: hypothetical protein PKB13_11315 [Clostridia bacterium]|jgi:hypothetical protein|nr:hypothetical protein [Clostridia bacterium]